MTAQQQQQQDTVQDAAQQAVIVSVVIGAAVSAASAAATLAALPVYRLMSRELLEGVLSIVMGMPPEVFGVSGAATGQAVRLNQMRRAQFAVAAIGRCAQAMRQARSQGTDPLAALAAQVFRERQYYGLHLDAMRGRMTAAARVDSEAMTWGLLLGWYAREDRITSPECRAADGKNFRADAMPLIGFPGAVHPHCRCMTGPPHPGARLLPSAHATAPARIPVPA